MPEGSSDPRRKAAVHMKPKGSITAWRAAGWPQARVRGRLDNGCEVIDAIGDRREVWLGKTGT